MSEGFHVLIFFEAKPGKAEALGQILADLIAPYVAKALAKVNAEDMLTQPFTAQQLRSIG